MSVRRLNKAPFMSSLISITQAETHQLVRNPDEESGRECRKGWEKLSNNQASKGRTERERKRNETVEYRLLPFV